MVGYKRVTDPVQVAENVRRIAPSLEQVCVPSRQCQNNGPMLEGLVAPWTGARDEKFYSYPLRAIFVVDDSSSRGLSTSSKIVSDGVKKVVWVWQSWDTRLDRMRGMLDHWLARLNGEDGFWENEQRGTEESAGDPDDWLSDIIR